MPQLGAGGDGALAEPVPGESARVDLGDAARGGDGLAVRVGVGGSGRADRALRASAAVEPSETRGCVTYSGECGPNSEFGVVFRIVGWHAVT